MFAFVLFLVTVNLCNQASGVYNPCRVSYKTIKELVPYCGASSWLHWDCLNKCTGIPTQMNNITRLRALCCSTGHDCFEECHLPKDYDKDTQYCGSVCPPFFTSSPPSTVRTTTATTPSTNPAPSSSTTTQQPVVTLGNVVGPGNGITNAPAFSSPLTTMSTPSFPKTTAAKPIVSTSQLKNVNVDTTQTESATATAQQTLAISTTISTPSYPKIKNTTSIISTRQLQNIVGNVDTTQTLSTTALTQQTLAISTETQKNANGLVTPTVPTTLAQSGQTYSISRKNSDGVADKTCPLGPWTLHDNYDLPGR